MTPDPDELTSRQRQVVRLVVDGWGNSEIGVKLFVTRETISTHVSDILSRLNLRNRTQLAVWAVRAGIDNQPEGKA